MVFDEADALFGAGSEVDNSRHRYANLEVNYLLARTGPRVARSSDLKAVLMRVVSGRGETSAAHLPDAARPGTSRTARTISPRPQLTETDF